MGNEEGPIGPGAETTASGATADGAAPGSTTHDTIAIEPTTPPAGADPGVLDPVRSTFAGARARRALGLVLLVAWAVWLVALWVAQPRLVSPDFLAEDLAQGRVTGYRLVTVDEDPVRGPMSGPYRIDVYPASEPVNDVLDSDADGRPVSIAYWVDAPVAGLRVLDANGYSSDTPAVLASLRAADVPVTAASVLYRGAPSQRLNNGGTVLLVVSTLVVILGPRPRRGTRWFWFWLVGGPLSVGVAVYAVAELIRPRYEPADTVHPPGVAGRWSGLAGFATSILLSIGGGLILMGLTGLSPIWFIRG